MTRNFIFFLTLMVACPLLAQSQKDLSLTLKDLREAPIETALDGKSISATAYVWRDFAPGTSSGGDGTPMMAAVRLTMFDKSSIPVGVKVDRIWVIYDDQAWEASYFRNRPKNAPPEKDGWVDCSNVQLCEVTARDGPKWGPDVYVDVVVRFVDKDRTNHLVRIPHQLVIGTQ